jgi:protein xylosyltransferase
VQAYGGKFFFKKYLINSNNWSTLAMIIALFRRFKLFFFIGIAILLIQIFLAYKSIKIPIETGSKSLVNKIISEDIHQKQFPVHNDDEDIINSNIQQNSDAVQKQEKSSTNLLSELKFKPKCDILKDKEVVSAIQRARTQKCKEFIVNVACEIKAGHLYPVQLKNTCPSGNYISNRSLGCYKDDKKHRLLSKSYSNFKETNSPKKCIQTCLQSGYIYAGVQVRFIKTNIIKH